ncbi:MAG TPA: CAP domain-containing protein, partial [Spirochaetia bacterium]|nr:CAP domain-containing protein [Spirochaetia bacterium]
MAAPAATAQAQVLAWVNQARQRTGLPPVESDDLLSTTAQAWSRYLAATGLLSHTGSDGSRVLDRYRAVGGTDARVGEILGAGRNLGEIERAWLGSDSHRQLVLEPFWTNVGWGSSKTSSGEEVWVVVF